VARERERAVRLALGASRGQLISNVIAEALVLAVIGGGAGLALAAFGIAAVSSAIANQLPAGTKLALDPMVVMFTAGIAILSALLIAAIPAWQAHGGAGGLVLREGRNAGAGSARNRSRSILAAAEIAMAMVLLIGAGLTIKSLLEMGRAKTGFDTRNLLTFEYRVPKAKYPSDGAQNEFHKRVIEEIRAIPGVIAASSVRAVPLAGNGSTGPFVLLDRPEPPAAERPQAMLNVADPYFFSTMRIPVLRGRDFSEHDTNHSAHVVVINQTMATRYFQERDPIGQSIRIPPANNMTAQIVGVVGDVKQFSNTDLPVPQIYGVLSQNPFVFASVAVRTATDPNSLMPEIRRAVWRVDKDQPMWKMRTADARLAMLAQPQQLMSSLLGGYAGLALLLAAIGIFGVISYSVSQRTAEIGVRMALGASPGDVAKVILQQGVIVIGIGITVGLGAAAWLTQFLKSQLYAVSTLDASVYAIVAGVLGTVSLAACWIPARRAMKVDPVVALRAE
jgi:putative ABC transport system permease protein